MKTKTQANKKDEYLQAVKEHIFYKGLLAGSNQILDRITAMRDEAENMMESAEDKLNAARAALDAAPQAGEAAPSSRPLHSEG